MTYRSIVAADLSIETDAVLTFQAGRAGATGSADPLDTNPVADLDGANFCTRSELDDLADTFVASNLSSRRRGRQGPPATGHDTKVRVADAGMSTSQMGMSACFDVMKTPKRSVQRYKDLTRSRLGHVQFRDRSRDLAWLVVNDGLVLFGDLGCHDARL